MSMNDMFLLSLLSFVSVCNEVILRGDKCADDVAMSLDWNWFQLQKLDEEEACDDNFTWGEDMKQQ
jgi:hypothetical protein